MQHPVAAHFVDGQPDTEVEVCDGADNDCDGATDEASEGFDLCAPGG